MTTARIDSTVIAEAREAYGEHPEVASTLTELAKIRRLWGDYDKAEHLARETLVMRRKLLGSDLPETAASVENLARILRLRGDLEETESR